jgi:hypothetical protein
VTYSYCIILAFAAFLMTLAGTRLAIFRLRRQVGPDVRVLTGKIKPPPLENAGVACLFALAPCLAATGADYVIILSLFLLGGMALLALAMFVPPWLEAGTLALAAALPLVLMDAPLGGFALFLRAVVWLWLMRFFQRMDKAPGAAGTLAASAGLAVALILALDGRLPGALAMQALVLAAVGAGIGWWSWPHPRVRLGRIGNYPLGFTAGYVWLSAADAGYGASAMIWLAYPLAQACFTRVLSAATIAGLQALLVLLAVLAARDPAMAPVHLGIAYAMTPALLWVVSRKNAA